MSETPDMGVTPYNALVTPYLLQTIYRRNLGLCEKFFLYIYRDYITTPHPYHTISVFLGYVVTLLHLILCVMLFFCCTYIKRRNTSRNSSMFFCIWRCYI